MYFGSYRKVTTCRWRRLGVALWFRHPSYCQATIAQKKIVAVTVAVKLPALTSWPAGIRP